MREGFESSTPSLNSIPMAITQYRPIPLSIYFSLFPSPSPLPSPLSAMLSHFLPHSPSLFLSSLVFLSVHARMAWYGGIPYHTTNLPTYVQYYTPSFLFSSNLNFPKMLIQTNTLLKSQSSTS